MSEVSHAYFFFCGDLWLARRAPHVLEKTRPEALRQFLDESSDRTDYSGKQLGAVGFDMLLNYLF